MKAIFEEFSQQYMTGEKWLSISTEAKDELILALGKFKSWLENADLGISREQKADLFIWLASNRYFETPASGEGPRSHFAGLFLHSHYVTETLSKYTSKLGLRWERPISPMIIGYFHDIYKIGPHIWDGTVQCGDASVLWLATRFILTEEEMLCIRCHVNDYENSSPRCDAAIRRYPNVLYARIADMCASKIIGV